MPVKEFTFEPGLMKDFMDLDHEIYRGDGNWIPPIRGDLARQLGPDFPFYRKAGNHHRKFVAVSGGKVCGRIVAMVNGEMKTGEGEQIGTLGFFECINDHHVARDLIGSSLQWLTGEMGISHVWGPMNFDIWHGYRFMTKGFDQDLFYGEPYNKPYYPDFFERCGFNTNYSWDSLELRGRDNMERAMRRGLKRYAHLREKGYRFESFNRWRFSRDIRKLHTLVSGIFVGFPGFTSISFDEFGQLYPGMRLAMKPELITFAYNEKGQTAGFAAAFPDLAEAVRAAHRKMVPVTLLRFLKMRRRADRIIFHLGGITREEISRGTGLGRAGFYYTLNQALILGFEKIMLTMRLLGNPSRSLPGPDAPKPQREYALYGMSK